MHVQKQGAEVIFAQIINTEGIVNPFCVFSVWHLWVLLG